MPQVMLSPTSSTDRIVRCAVISQNWARCRPSARMRLACAGRQRYRSAERQHCDDRLSRQEPLARARRTAASSGPASAGYCLDSWEPVAHKLCLQGSLRGVHAPSASRAQQARMPAELPAAGVPWSDMAVREITQDQRVPSWGTKSGRSDLSRENAYLTELTPPAWRVPENIEVRCSAVRTRRLCLARERSLLLRRPPTKIALGLCSTQRHY